MITAGIIRNGANYLSHHLKKNDYWAEGEKEVNGEWIGEAARALGLSGAVTEEAFEALRCNKHPTTGETLTHWMENERSPSSTFNYPHPRMSAFLQWLEAMTA